jgi:hypothetical protein
MIVHLRENEQDASGVEVCASILRAASPVLDEILAAHSSSGAPRPPPVITLDCSAEELNAFVMLLSSLAHGAPKALALQDLVDHAASAMRMLTKYDVDGVLNVLDVLVYQILPPSVSGSDALAVSIAGVQVSSLKACLEARLASLPPNAPADCVPQAAYDFLASHYCLCFRSTYHHQARVTSDPARAAAYTETRAAADMLMMSSFPVAAVAKLFLTACMKY